MAQEREFNKLLLSRAIFLKNTEGVKFFLKAF